MLHMSMESDMSNMYSDLAEEFRDNEHRLTIMAPDEDKHRTYLHEERGMRVLRIKAKPPILGVKNMFRKGVGLALLPYQYKRAYKSYLKDEEFDWIIMPTPPITLIDFVAYVKDITNAKFYLILRDIHPQSAASIGLIRYRFMYNYLAQKAAKAYNIADYIGCMSQGNIDFITSNYSNIDKSKLGLLLNWQKFEKYKQCNTDVRKIYNLQNKFVVLFGGNIGLGQRIENILMLARHYINNLDIVFLVIGKGVKKDELLNIAFKENLNNIKFMEFMPRNNYREFVESVDLGLISISEKYSVPTCPSKAVAYMSLKIPIFAIINQNNDYGKFIEKSGAGYWVVGGDEKRILTLFEKIYEDSALRKKMSENGYRFYLDNLTSKKAYLDMMYQINSIEKV